MNRKRISAIALLVGLMVLIAAVSWIAGSMIQSPAEAAARIAPPQPSPILVPVEERVLSAKIVTRGTARFGLPQSIAIAPSSLKVSTGVITTLPEEGVTFQEGDVILTASGRPLFVLYGERPAYRDLTLGISGEDVRQLEEALARLGLEPGPVDGLYDEETSNAVSALYSAAGWEPFGPTQDQLDQIRALEHELILATNEMLAAEDGAATAPLIVDAAQAEAENANQAITAENDVSALALKAVQLAGEVLIQEALNTQKVAQREVEATTKVVAQIAEDLAAHRAQAGVQIPLDELVFVSSLPIRVDQLEVAVGDDASGPVMLVTNNQVAIDASLPLDKALLVEAGMAVAIDEPDLGIEAIGVVARVADTPGTDGADGYHVYFETLVNETSTSLDGFSLRLTIPTESSGGAVTTVPISALSLAPDGSSRVQIEQDGLLTYIAVEPGFSANGFVEITASDGGQLVPGQLVVIGFEQPSQEITNE